MSQDKRWIVTGDSGNDSIIVVWDSATFTPVKTLFNVRCLLHVRPPLCLSVFVCMFVQPHPRGVLALDISADAMYIATLSFAVAGPWRRPFLPPLLRHC